MCHMEVYDEDGTPALPFAVPPPVPVQYDIPPGMVSHDNLVLSRTYDKLGSAVNGIFTRIHDEPKIDVVPHYEVATTKALVDEVLWVVLRVSNLIQQIEGNGGVAFAMPQVLKEGIDFIRPFGTD